MIYEVLKFFRGLGLGLDQSGLGLGLEEDTYGLRKVASQVDELVFVASCSKNFGLYRDRVGVATFIGAPEVQPAVESNLFQAAERIQQNSVPNLETPPISNGENKSSGIDTSFLDDLL